MPKTAKHTHECTHNLNAFQFTGDGVHQKTALVTGFSSGITRLQTGVIRFQFGITRFQLGVTIFPLEVTRFSLGITRFQSGVMSRCRVET